MRTKESLGPAAQKILLLLLGGLVLGLSGSPHQYFSVLKTIGKDWERINKRALHNAIKNLYRSKLIDAKDNSDGTTTLSLTNKGKTKALTYQIDEIKVRPMKKWDHKWRLVLFDIPESRKKARDALSLKLKRAGFYKLQKSVFISPFECQEEIDFVIEFFSLSPYVRTILADHIDNELHLKTIFNL
ncbi:MAG: CRISPR-associated endonuclease Cas2 [bacterium]|nr:CRISPR-associated endonuclease Cas2 [bacterium]